MWEPSQRYPDPAVQILHPSFVGRLAEDTALLDRYDGKPLNSPNDVVVKSGGSIWFTDPPFGIHGYYEGHPEPQELPANVYRIDGKTGRASWPMTSTA